MIVLILLLLVELYFLRRILSYFLLSPIYLYTIFSLLSIIITVLYFYFYDDKFSLFNLDSVSEKDFLKTIKSYIIALIAFIGGVLVYYDLSKKKVKKAFNQAFTKSLFFNFKSPRNIILVARILLLLIVILFLITYGKDIFYRDEYLPDTNRALTILIKILSFIEVVILGIAFNRYKRKSLFYFSVLILISIGTGSRAVFLFYFIYITIMFISNGNSLKNKTYFALNVFFSLFFLAYIMGLRELESHGIIPYFKSVVTSDQDFIKAFIFNIYYSLIYGVFVTIKTIQESKFDWNIIWISINPLPGKLAGWYDYANDMRINIYAPFSLHGRVFRMGMLFTVVYFLISGIIFSYMEKKVRIFLNEGKRLLAFTLILLLTLHIIYGFEYNMRAAIRYIYYALFLIIITELLKYIWPYLPKKSNDSSN